VVGVRGDAPPPGKRPVLGGSSPGLGKGPVPLGIVGVIGPMPGGVAVGKVGCAPPRTSPGCDVPRLGGVTGDGTVVGEVGKVAVTLELPTEDEVLPPMLGVIGGRGGGV
jgi:hypothetical protein